MLKNPPSNAGDIRDGKIPCQRDGNSLQYSAWRVPWIEEAGGLESMGSQRVRHNGSNLAHAHTLVIYAG